MNTVLSKKETLPKLLFYFEELKSCIDRIYPADLSLEEIVENHYVDLSWLKHPDWVKAHFPLILIYHKEKAGKLRKSKSIDVMYQNNFNVITQLICRADDFGIHQRKNNHKGFKNIVGAIKIPKENVVGLYGDKQKPIKYKNFDDLNNRYGLGDPFIKIFCDVLSEHYECDSHGQLKLL